MTIHAMTLEQVRQLGITALTKQLGMVGMIRFLQQSETGWGDYTKDRERWLGNSDLKDLFTEIKNSEKQA